MWQDGDDLNIETGEYVKIYQPDQASKGEVNVEKSSHIGGYASSATRCEDTPKCSSCSQSMYLLVELHVEKEKLVGDAAKKFQRSLSVFACPSTTCFNSIKFTKGFLSGGQGIMTCRCAEREVVTNAVTVPSPAIPVAPVKSAWYSNSDENGAKEDDDDNDWNVDEDDIGMDTGNNDDLESALEAMEVQEAAKTDDKKPNPKPKQRSQKQQSKSCTSSTSSDVFDCYALTGIDEPPAPRPQVEEDDVGGSASDEKIRNMLARYMAEEEDPEILAALQGVNVGSGGGGGGEADERLSLEDRVLLGFQDRLKRSPRQVVRYARGGVPLWSIPCESSDSGGDSKKKQKKKKNSFEVPPCACGAGQIFEFQLLPSLLHVLEVDKYSSIEGEDKQANSSSGRIYAMFSTGMNWGGVAVYTCPNSCQKQEPYLVVQESVDGPANPPPQQGAVDGEKVDLSPATMAVVEDLDDDAEFQPDA